MLWRANAELEPGIKCNQVGKLPVGRLVGRNLPSTFYLLFFNGLGRNLAERVGFEPTKGYKPLLVFKTSAFDHSATSPALGRATAHSAGSRARIQYAAVLKFVICRPYPAVSKQELSEPLQVIPVEARVEA